MPSFLKELMLEELVKSLQAKNYIFFAKHQGLSATDFVELRRKLEKVADKAVVTKNSIARLALKRVGIEDANGFIKGSILLAVSNRDPELVSKVLVEFAKGRDNFELGGAYLEGNIFSPESIRSIAALPPRQMLLASVACGLNAPICGFVNVLSQLMRSLAVCLNQIQKAKAN